MVGNLEFYIISYWMFSGECRLIWGMPSDITARRVGVQWLLLRANDSFYLQELFALMSVDFFACVASSIAADLFWACQPAANIIDEMLWQFQLYSPVWEGLSLFPSENKMERKFHELTPRSQFLWLMTFTRKKSYGAFG